MSTIFLIFSVGPNCTLFQTDTNIEGGSPVDGMQDPDACSERWTNLADDSKKTMWGVFVETGIFIATCRHGVIVAACDMIRSGEL